MPFIKQFIHKTFNGRHLKNITTLKSAATLKMPPTIDNIKNYYILGNLLLPSQSLSGYKEEEAFTVLISKDYTITSNLHFMHDVILIKIGFGSNILKTIYSFSTINGKEGEIKLSHQGTFNNIKFQIDKIPFRSCLTKKNVNSQDQLSSWDEIKRKTLFDLYPGSNLDLKSQSLWRAASVHIIIKDISAAEVNEIRKVIAKQLHPDLINNSDKFHASQAFSYGNNALDELLKENKINNIYT